MQKTDEEHLAQRDERWIAAIDNSTKGQLYVRKSAIVGVSPVYINFKEKPGLTALMMENGLYYTVSADPHEFWETHLKSSFSTLQPEGPGEDLLMT